LHRRGITTIGSRHPPARTGPRPRSPRE
jgi:hypothetical protein